MSAWVKTQESSIITVAIFFALFKNKQIIWSILVSNYTFIFTIFQLKKNISAFTGVSIFTEEQADSIMWLLVRDKTIFLSVLNYEITVRSIVLLIPYMRSANRLWRLPTWASLQALIISAVKRVTRHQWINPHCCFWMSLWTQTDP